MFGELLCKKDGTCMFDWFLCNFWFKKGFIILIRRKRSPGVVEFKNFLRTWFQKKILLLIFYAMWDGHDYWYQYSGKYKYLSVCHDYNVYINHKYKFQNLVVVRDIGWIAKVSCDGIVLYVITYKNRFFVLSTDEKFLYARRHTWSLEIFADPEKPKSLQILHMQ